MTFTDSRTTPEQIASLREHFEDDAIIELTALLAFQNLSSKFNAALGVLPQGFCSVRPDVGDGAANSSSRLSSAQSVSGVDARR